MGYRWAHNEDIGALVRLRQQQLDDEGEERLFPIEAELNAYFTEGLSSGRDVMLVYEEDGKILAVGGLAFHSYPPSFTNPTGEMAWLHSVYTDPAHRGKGFAGELVRRLKQEAKQRGIRKVFLQASPQGMPVYAKQGFAGAGYMQARTDDL